MMPFVAVSFDWTVHVSDVMLFGAGIWAFITMFVSLRDAIRDLSVNVGKKHPREGLLGDVEHMKEEIQEHRDWLIAAGLDRRVQSERRQGV
jgi:hypothetical protein